MKKTYILLLSVIIHLVIVEKATAQLKLGDQPTSVQKSVILDLQGSNGRQGVWLPRITDTTDATGIDGLNPPDGVMIYHVPSSQVMIRRNGYWSSLQTITKVGSTTSSASTIEFQLGTAAGASKDLNWALNSATGVVTLNVPDAAVDTRGVVNTGAQAFGGLKTFNDGLTSLSTTTVSGASSNASNLYLGINSATTPGATTDRFLTVDNSGRVVLSSGIPTTRSLNINGTSYDLSADRSWNVGTVTSLTGGYGLNGGTITTSGTLSLDTSAIATRAWRQKGIDSLAVLIAGYVTATRSITINGATQDLSANRTWNVGTVTGITGGYGINGGTINTSGTFNIDTASISTRAWRQKGIDSLAGSIGSIYVPLTRTLNGLSLSSNQTFATGTSGTDFNISSAGTTHTFNIPTASATNRGLLSSADWSTFNNKGTVNSVTGGYGINGGTITNTGTLSIDTTSISTRAWRQKGLDSLATTIGGAYVPLTRSITINGTTYDLSANRTWNVGTVTGITGGYGIVGGTINTSGTFRIDTAALSTKEWRQKGIDSLAGIMVGAYVPLTRTLNGLALSSNQTFATGTSGTDFNISSSGTAHTFNFPTASATNRGLLSSADWSTFNNKGTVNSVTGGYGINGGTITNTGTLSIDTTSISTRAWRQKGLDSLGGLMTSGFVPTTRTVTINGTTYDLSANRTWSVGTVTGITGGYGIVGGTINTSGTFRIDTAALSTKEWRQKGIDSLAGIMVGAYVPLTRTLNGLALSSNQTFALGTAGTDASISSSGTTHTFNFPTASATNRGLLSSADWSTFNNKGTVNSVTGGYGINGGTITNTGTLSIDTTSISTRAWRQKGLDSLATTIGGAYVPLTRSITINGTTYDLSANRTWSVGTVTGITGGYGIVGGTINTSGTFRIDTAALSTREWRQKGIDSLAGIMVGAYVPLTRTLNGLALSSNQTFALGTAGTDASISSSGTTHTFNFPTASATNRGLLSSADWSTFNNKGTVNSVTGGYGINGGTITNTGTLSIDTTSISTRAWRQKGLDSLGGLMTSGFVPTTRTVTINGTTYDLSANRTWSVGTVTGITGGYGIVGGTINTSGTFRIDTAALSTREWRQKGIDSLAGIMVGAYVPLTRTLNGLALSSNQTFALGTAGTDASISSSGTTHTFNFPTASATNRGLLSSADWSTFNNKGTVNSVTGGYGINGGTITNTGTLSIDTTSISTRAWRQKGLDSLATTIGGAYVPLTRSITINGTTYDLSANRTWSVGTVTGITGGYGIVGGTINTSGTFRIDTAALSTREWRQKGIDSLAGIMVGAYVPLTRTLNGLALSSNQTFALGTAGTDASISSSGTTHTFNFPTASATNRGLLSSADWSTFNNKGTVNSVTGGYGINGGTITNTGTLSIDTTSISTRAWRQKGLDSLGGLMTSGFVPTTRTVTINGTTYDLSANRTWSVGTVTGITGGYGIVGGTINTSGTFRIDTAALSTREWRQKGIDSLAGIMVGAYVPLTRTLNGLALSSNQTFALGTAGTDASISSSGTTHTFNFPTASATNRGLLSSADWTTFNNKVTSVTGGYGLNGGTITSTGTLSIDTTSIATRAWRQKGLDSLATTIGGAYVPLTRTLNGLALSSNQTFATGTSGTDFSISSSGTAHTFNLPTASATNRGLLSSADWTTFNNKGTVNSVAGGYGINGGTITNTGTLSIDTTSISTRAWRQKGLDSLATTIGGAYVPLTRSVTINGTTYDLSANRTWSVGTVTGITGGYGIVGGTINTSGTFRIDTAALSTKEWRQKGIDSLAGIMVGAYVPLTRTLNGLALSSNQTFALGTAGTDASISSSGTTHTFNFPTASATNRGLLSSADWSTFNNKGTVNSVTGGYGINGGTITSTGTLSIDTTSIATRAWRQKGLDSLATTIGGAYVPLTRTLNGLALSSNQTFATGTSGTDFNISSSGTAHTFNFPTASATNRGLLSSADWTTFNNKGTVSSVAGGYGINGGTITSTGTLSIDTTSIATRAWRQKGLDSLATTIGGAYVPLTRSVTINGTTYDLTANRTWNVGTVTGITGGYGINGGTINTSGTFTIDTAALSTKEWRQKGIDSLAGIMVGAYVPLTRTLNGLAMSSNQTFALGTAGTDASISSSGTTHTFNFPTASATNRGLLSAADWTTFNNKGTVSSVAGGYGINGGTITSTGTLSIDTTSIATRAWRQKGIDSVASLINGFIPASRTITINGTAYDLSANRSWSVGTVTSVGTGYGMTGGTITGTGTLAVDTFSVASREWRQKGVDSVVSLINGFIPATRTLNGLALSSNQTFALGTAGTDAGISSAGTTHTFNFPTASATNRGLLSSADWTTFNNKGTVSSVAGGYGINGGTITTTGTLSIDTTAISTREWRQKGIDSVASLINGFIPASRTITINGTAYDLSANRSWSVGTVTSVATGYGINGGAITSTGTLTADTLEVASRAWRQKGVDSVVSLLNAYVPATRTMNGLALSSNQTFAVGTSGTNFNISSAGTTHTFNIPDASATARGLVTTGAQTFDGVKTFQDPISSRVNLQAGSAAAGGAPLKFIAGTNLTTPEAGAVEFDGTNYFVTSGTTRYTLAKTLTTTANLNFPNFAGVATLNVTVTGAALSDAVVLGIPQSALTGSAVAFTAHVSAANTVTITAINYSGGWEDPAAGIFRVSVLKY